VLLPTPRQLGRRSSVVVLAVIAVAVAMLVVLLVQTSQHGNDVRLANAAGRERYLSGQLAAEAMAVRHAPGDLRERRVSQMETTIAEWRGAAARLRNGIPGDGVIDADPQTAPGFAGLVSLQREVIDAARAAADQRTTAADSVLAATQHRYVMAIDRVVGDMESDSAWELDKLVLVETLCVLLLLVALGLGMRLALQPTYARLLATLEALADSESRTRAVLDSMQEGMLLTDVDGHVLSCNPSALSLLGLADGSDAQMQSLFQRTLGQDGAPCPPDLLPVNVTLRTGTACTGETLGVRDDDGGVRWLSVNTQALRRDAGERPHAVVSIFRDITVYRRIAEERAAHAGALELQNRELMAQADALERGQALFRSVVETAGSAIVGLDTNGVVFEWNREAEALFGVARADAVGHVYVDSFVGKTHRQSMRAGIASVLGGDPLRNFVGEVQSRGGQQHTVLWNITPLRDGMGAPVHGLIAAGLDITDREASDERFRILFERSSDAHLLFDERGIIDCNEATLDMLRYASKASVLGRTPEELSPRRQPDGRLSVVVGGQMRQRAHLQGFHRFEWVHERADGTHFPVEITLTPVRLHGRSATLAVWHDITERRAVEDALRTAKDAAESANQTKSEFMTRMNHELRTPLTAIIGFSRVLLQGKEGELPAGAQRYTERIRANGMHLLSLINQILDVAKVEAGRMELDTETIALETMVQETFAMLESTAEAKGIQLRRELPERIAPFQTDAGKLRQILINLVGNAIKFTAEGEVCVRVRADPATGRPVSISIADTGIGIPLERQQKVFDPFEQGDSSTRRQFGGTGLGLSIVKTFADLIGARIAVESEVGRGTTFTLWLAEPALVAAAVGSVGEAAG
jgi:PAS domain S-box-containing protein